MSQQLAASVRGGHAWPAADLVGLALAVVVGSSVAAYALWYTSSGRFPAFPPIQNDYVDLGSAFLRGQLSLPETPDPRLADLGDPYEYTQRKGIPYHWDASYYGGKYYLYWGPVPALVSAGVQAASGTPPPASLLVVLPFVGLMAVAIWLLWLLAEASGSIGRLTVWLFVIVGFFSLPMLFTIGQPRHYQASILYGQFFLLLGVLGIAQHAARSKRCVACPERPILGFRFRFALQPCNFHCRLRGLLHVLAPEGCSARLLASLGSDRRSTCSVPGGAGPVQSRSLRRSAGNRFVVPADDSRIPTDQLLDILCSIGPVYLSALSADRRSDISVHPGPSLPAIPDPGLNSRPGRTRVRSDHPWPLANGARILAAGNGHPGCGRLAHEKQGRERRGLLRRFAWAPLLHAGRRRRGSVPLLVGFLLCGRALPD